VRPQVKQMPAAVMRCLGANPGSRHQHFGGERQDRAERANDGQPKG
jgi:hypothetical protein